MKITDLAAGLTVYDVHSEYMGNTILRSLGVWPIYIVQVDRDNNKVLAKWNGNEARWYFEGQFKKWKVKKPELVRDCMGRLVRKPRDKKT